MCCESYENVYEKVLIQNTRPQKLLPSICHKSHLLVTKPSDYA